MQNFKIAGECETMNKSLRLEIDVGTDVPKQIIGLDEIDNIYILSLHAGVHSQIVAMEKPNYSNLVK